MRILANLETPTIAVLRDSQNYEYAAAHGLGIYEMPRFRVRQDLQQMELIIDWLDQQLMRTFEPTLISRINPLPRLFASSAFGHSHPD
jgi:hypothetical protein